MDKKLQYFKNFSNWVDQFSTLLVLIILIRKDWFNDWLSDMTYEHVLSAVVVSLTWFQLFYWMKLFNQTAFFMNLLAQIFDDVNFRAFFIMTVLMILAFANIIYILNIQRGPDYAYDDGED